MTTVGQPWISVLTTPARQKYLASTIATLEAAGASAEFHRAIHVDGDDRLVADFSGWEKISVSSREPARGTRLAMWRIFYRGALNNAPFLLYFEDDIAVCKNTVTAMAALAVPDEFDFISFLQMNPVLPMRAGKLRRVNGTPFWGAQALKLPARSLARFVHEIGNPVGQYTQACDNWLGEHLKGAVVDPTIVRHVGEETTIPVQLEQGVGLHRPEDLHRRGLNYAGDDFDAMEIIR